MQFASFSVQASFRKEKASLALWMPMAASRMKFLPSLAGLVLPVFYPYPAVSDSPHFPIVHRQRWFMPVVKDCKFGDQRLSQVQGGRSSGKARLVCTVESCCCKWKVCPLLTYNIVHLQVCKGGRPRHHQVAEAAQAAGGQRQGGPSLPLLLALGHPPAL